MNKHTYTHVCMFFVVLFSILIFSLVLTVTSLAEATTSIRYVQPGADGSCTSWADTCDLQVALEKAKSGDQVWVARGIYYPGDFVADTFTFKDGVALYGGFPASGGEWNQRDWVTNPTILSADIDHNDQTEGGVVTNTVNIKGSNAFHVVTIAFQASATLDGFIITAGDANGSDYPYDDGGGLYNNAGILTVDNVIFSGNTGSCGGGMTNARGTVTLTQVTFANNQGGLCNYAGGTAMLNDVIFSSNSTTSVGGAMNNVGNAMLTDVIFSDNFTTDWGAGMTNAYYGYAVLTDVTFSGNTALGWGGGLWISGGTLVLTNVTFSSNQAYGNGGGMAISWGSVEFTNVTFSNNKAVKEGGGLFNNGTATLTKVTFSGNQANQAGGGISYYWGGSLALTNVTLSGNSAVRGGGIYNLRSNPTLTNVTLISNSASQDGGGIYNNEYEGIGSHPILTNSILWGNSPDQIYMGEASSATVIYSDIQGGWDGEGNINADPLLAALTHNGGLIKTHALGEGSPAIDAGNPTTCPPTDQRGVTRPLDGNSDGIAICDMGSYEYIPVAEWLYMPLLMK